MGTNWVSAQGAVCGAKGTDRGKRFQQKIIRDTEHGLFSFRFGNVEESSEAV
jgi:hypothetical protein